jgi:hypothetical protein
MNWFRWRVRLARLRHRERHLAWRLDLWPDEAIAPVLEYVRFARRQAELGRWGPYPQTGTGSR